jgi:TnpA family transposase
LLEALTEYNRLVKASYLLSYIDDASLRNYVQRALNRGEAYHQLRRAISHVNGDRFRGNSDEEIQL